MSTRHPAPPDRSARRPTRTLHRDVGAIAAAAILLGACATASAPRFHSLAPAPVTPAAKAAPASGLAWEVVPISVPPGVDQPQWVVRGVDGSLVVLEQERWIAPLGDELRAAVSAQLVQMLGAPAASAPTVWRVRIDVLRFESAPGREARVDAVWSLASDAAPSAVAVRCRGEYVQSLATDGYLAIASAQQKNVALLGGSIAAALGALGAGRPATCGG